VVQLRSTTTAKASNRSTAQAGGKTGSRVLAATPLRHGHPANTAPQRDAWPPLLQPKLTFSRPNDVYEREADRVADQVMRMPDPAWTRPGIDPTPIRPLSLQRRCAECEDELQRRVQGMQAESPASGLDTVAAVLRQDGRALDPATRSFFEPRFGADFSAVRIHTDAHAAESARAVDALAYTVGRDVVFNSGQYAPHRDSGKRLLAHELAHVVQQGAANESERVQRQPMPEQTYIGKTFVVKDNNAVLRNFDLTSKKYERGDDLPAGKKIGDAMTVPKGTEVYVFAVNVDADRNVYAHVWRKGAVLGIFPAPLGWIAVTNFDTGFDNQAIGNTPAGLDLPAVFDLNQTVVDDNAVLRDGGPGYAATGNKVPRGTYVVALERSGDTKPEGRYLKIREVIYRDQTFTAGAALGWTAASNLRKGWADMYGPTAAWEDGQYLGQVNLVGVSGLDGQAEQITADSYPKYTAMVAAADPAPAHIVLNSGFRTYPEQARLRRLYEQGTGNLAAKPGYSNHQNGRAFDLNTTGSGGSGSGAAYDWLKANAWKYGFIRAVKSEHWHWEYQPDKVKEGKHTTWGV
jgi:hypothetical protein